MGGRVLGRSVVLLRAGARKNGIHLLAGTRANEEKKDDREQRRDGESDCSYSADFHGLFMPFTEETLG